ncbi:MAG: DNA modification methylase [Bacteroidales bacterium]|nr:DNA modification methylase [Bacteroidales bacterium]
MYYFREGFCWSDINTTYLKCRIKEKSINDVKSMSLYSMYEKTPEYYFISIINSEFMSKYVDDFVNNTQTFQINDARQIPIIIPDSIQLKVIEKLFQKSFILKKQKNNECNNELIDIQRELDKTTLSLYHLFI